MENSWKKYQFGFDVGAAVLFAAVMLPNIYWFAVPAPNDILRGASATPTIDIIGSVFQVLMIGLLCILKNTAAGKRTKRLWGAAACYGFYCAAWIAYYRNCHTCGDSRPVPCALPCLRFLCRRSKKLPCADFSGWVYNLPSDLWNCQFPVR